jgi:hypothetical protein
MMGRTEPDDVPSVGDSLPADLVAGVMALVLPITVEEPRTTVNVLCPTVRITLVHVVIDSLSLGWSLSVRLSFDGSGKNEPTHCTPGHHWP